MKKIDPNDPHNLDHAGASYHFGFPRGVCMKPCPFCGGHDLVMCNTHTPKYWIECEGCEAELSGGYGPDLVGGRYGTERQHRASRDDVLEKWNRRRPALGERVWMVLEPSDRVIPEAVAA